MKLNCDLGESYGVWHMGNDSAIIPHIDQANIACGFHAGDADTIVRTLLHAKQHNVEIGAHASYPDLNGFGRRSMTIDNQSLINLLHYQIAALDGIAAVYGLSVSYVKPHGALYNDMMTNDQLMGTVITAVARYSKPLALVIQATDEQQKHLSIAQKNKVKLRFEAFADRQYLDNGCLVPRNKQGALLDRSNTLLQAKMLIEQGLVTTQSGHPIAIQADTLCLHGDNPESVLVVTEIRKLLKNR